jgi:aspartate aminotransferase
MTVANPAALTLSRRVASLKASATLAVSARVKELRAEGRDVVGFGAGEPDFDTPDHIKQAAIDALRAGQTGYAPVPGDPAARRAIAEKLVRVNGIQCRPEDVVITVGGKHALYSCLQCLVDPGQEQEVILLTPAWVSYRPMVELAGGTAVEVPGAVENDFKVTPSQIEAAITPRTRVIIINSPSNPCGTMYSPEELREIADVLLRHDHVVVISDEIYEQLIFTEVPHLSLGSLEALAPRVVTINGLSKSYAMTGWRIGYLCAPGADGALAKAASRLQSQMTSNITSFCYAAIVQALEHGAPDVERMRQTFAERGELIHSLISQWPDVRCPRPTGAFYVFPDISAYFGRTSPGGRQIGSAVAFAEALLEEAAVGVVPGDDFGLCARGNVRLSFATSNDMIQEGCRRVADWLTSLK